MTRYYRNSIQFRNWKLKTYFHPTCNALIFAVISILLVSPFTAVANEPLSTDNYRLDPNVSNSFGGRTDSGNYQLLDSGGEAAAGLGDSPSYKMSSGYIEQLEQAIEINVLPDGLDGYWPLNTGTGIQAYDTTTSNNYGVLTNNPGWAEGKVGSGALDFPGNSNTYTNQSDTNDQMANFTLSAWINPNDVSTVGQRIVIKDDGTTGWALSLGDGGTGQVRFYTRETSPVSTDTGNVIGAGNWYHVVAVFNTTEDTKTIYVNGKQEVRDTGVTGDPVDNGSELLFGKNFNGRVDEVKIYNKALSKYQVEDEYKASDSNIPNALTLPRITPGVSQTVNTDVIVRTDAGGYGLSIEQDGNLRTKRGSTIPSTSGTISNPAPWNEGSTTGFGFTVTDAVQRDNKWGADPDYEYAAVPGTSTTFHDRDGLSGGFKETAALQFRLGVDHTQASGFYQNRLGFTATLKP